MDATTPPVNLPGLGKATILPEEQSPAPRWRPEGCDTIALVLQGGGALGAYQAGIYQALHEAGLEPDSVAGVSIGGINAAIIAGNPRERRVERLRAFWEEVTARRVWWVTPDGDDARKARNTWSSLLTTWFGQPAFFAPQPINPWLSPRGGRTATSFYDTSPLRETLLRLVDFDLLNSGTVRYAAGSVNVLNGNFAFFDSRRVSILPEHVMASGALPPAFPMVRVGTDYYWDGGLVSNTPLQHVLDTAGTENTLIFQVDLFSARGSLPRDMHDVLARQKDIQYSSRTRLVTDYFCDRHARNAFVKQLLDKMPAELLTEEEAQIKERLSRLPRVTIVQMIYQQTAYETQSKDYEFSGTSMRDHWESGYRDTQRTLRHTDWLELPQGDGGLVTHDIHRVDD
ncbi:MAG TPA: patatin-like phospholipase family protein [Rhodopila sp.]|uniref:patatin-like phospholipase family protein n=1 Tax=Rhodopila sp. TaxID=2480087 RepID=UPI002CCCD63B|nr:patatin-like phospholipase family protein [Rhodopila sp.]HVY15692.1 patatin-like phospholipase family protein [Rhodopila sp.]